MFDSLELYPLNGIKKLPQNASLCNYQSFIRKFNLFTMGILTILHQLMWDLQVFCSNKTNLRSCLAYPISEHDLKGQIWNNHPTTSSSKL